MTFDTPLFRLINHGPESWTPAMRFFSEALNHTPGRAILLVVILALLTFRTGRGAVLQSLIAVGLANETTDWFKWAWPMSRPFQVIPDAILRVGYSDSMGTASAHSANMAAIATVMMYRLGWRAFPWAMVAFLVGYSRVFCAAHFPYQVALGWAVGVAMGLMVVKAWDLIVARRKVVLSATPDES